MTDEQKQKMAEEYAARRWPTKAEWLEKYQSGLMAYEIRYEVEEAFESGLNARDEEVLRLTKIVERIGETLQWFIERGDIEDLRTALKAYDNDDY